MQDTIHFTCPNCHHSLQLPSSAVGKRGKCPGCGEITTIQSEVVGPPEILNRETREDLQESASPASDTIDFSCTSCSASFPVPKKFAGKSGRCPKCGAPITIPDVTTSPPEQGQSTVPPSPIAGWWSSMEMAERIALFTGISLLIAGIIIYDFGVEQIFLGLLGLGAIAYASLPNIKKHVDSLVTETFTRYKKWKVGQQNDQSEKLTPPPPMEDAADAMLSPASRISPGGSGCWYCGEPLSTREIQCAFCSMIN